MWIHVPAVAAAVAELDDLIEAEALPDALHLARTKLRDAMGEAQAARAKERRAKLDVAAKERQVAQMKRRDEEQKLREGADRPIAALQFGGIRVVVFPEVPMDPAGRASLAAAFGMCYRLIARNFQQPLDPDVLLRECEDILRFGIRLGAARVERAI